MKKVALYLLKKVVRYLYMIFLIIIVFVGVPCFFLGAMYLGLYSYEIAFYKIPLIVWGIVNAIIFIILFASPTWFLIFLNEKLDLEVKIMKVNEKIMSFIK